MGMYSVPINDNLYVKNREQFRELAKEYPNADLPEHLFFEDCEAKFFGYWSEASMEAYNELGKRGIFEGEFEVEYEEGFDILCKFDENGFAFKISEKSYPEKWSY